MSVPLVRDVTVSARETVTSGNEWVAPSWRPWVVPGKGANAAAPNAAAWWVNVRLFVGASALEAWEPGVRKN
jgi:hypothetical protein